MQIVIDIDKEIYNYIKQLGSIPTRDTQYIANVIFDGIPLPKGHGRLIDAEVLPEISLFGTTEYINVKKAPTIIEADKEESEG